MSEIEKFANENVCILIVGNKCDMDAQRKVTYAQGSDLAKHYKVPFIEASAKSGFNVDETFLMISKEVYRKQQAMTKKGKSTPVKGETKILTMSIDEKKAPCCS